MTAPQRVDGYLDFEGMLMFFGGKSRAWGRLHVSEIPHFKLYDRLLFDPEELRRWLVRTAKRQTPVNVDVVVSEVLPKAKRRT